MSTIVAVDFDGTLAEHQYPGIGLPVSGALEWCKRFQDAGAQLFLWTMRDDTSGPRQTLTEAVLWCHDHGLYFWGHNENPEQAETRWSHSPKQFAHVYVDDMAAGAPLVRPGGDRWPYLDWGVVGPQVLDQVLARKDTHVV